MSPLFSICVPAFNCEKWISECIDSIIEQKFKDYELIVVDDGSTDATGTIVDGYSRKHNCIHVLHKENQGLIRARVDAINVASGEYIICLDGDDVMLPDALSNIEDSLEGRTIDVLMYDHESFSEKGKSSHTNTDAKELLLSGDRVKIIRAFYRTKLLNSACFKVMRRNLFDTSFINEAYEVRMGEDWFISLCPMLYGKEYSYCEFPCYGYRIHGNSMTDSYDYTYWKTLLLMHKYQSESLKTEAAGICRQNELDINLLQEMSKCLAYVYGRPHDIHRYHEMLTNIRSNTIVFDIYNSYRKELSLLYRIPLYLMYKELDLVLYIIKLFSATVRKRLYR